VDTRPEIVSNPSVDKLRESIEERRKQLASFKTPYTRAAVFLDQWVQKNFQTEGGKVGGWKPFSPKTLEEIAKEDPGRLPAKLLQKTGRMRISFMPFVETDDAGIGTAIPYARSHELGIGRLPQRRLLPTKDMVMGDIRRIFDGYVTEVLKK
jgi:phage gpG-like protein